MSEDSEKYPNLTPFTKDDNRASECGKIGKRKPFDLKLRERLEKEGKLDTILEVLEGMAISGDIRAIKELFDRSYGKSKQNIEIGNADDDGLKINIIKKNADN